MTRTTLAELFERNATHTKSLRAGYFDAVRGSDADTPSGVEKWVDMLVLQGVYGDVRRRAYLVNADGETDPDALRGEVPEEYGGHVRRLL